VHSADFQAGLEDRETYVAELDGDVAGWASVGWKDRTWWMDDLWVLPAFMRHGVGTALVERAVSRGRALGAARLEWEADANAGGFYEHLGARHVGDSDQTSGSDSLPLYALEFD
jgi:GNAT superfamily N-acetyltransferase